MSTATISDARDDGCERYDAASRRGRPAELIAAGERSTEIPVMERTASVTRMRILCIRGLLAAMISPALVQAQAGYTLASVSNPSVLNLDFGTSVAFVGDVEGDGVEDYAVGDRYARAGGSASAGAIHIISGATGVTIRVHAGVAGEGLGASVAGLGDIDHDGVPDYIGGAPAASPGGRAYAWSGATGALIHTFSGTATVACIVPFPCAPISEQLGASVAGPGDLNGDGTPDILIGSPTLTLSNAAIMTGGARVFSGASGAALFGINGGISWAVLGTSVAGGGDLNHDGIPDIVVGMPRISPLPYGNTPGGTGSIHAIAGGTGATLWVASGSQSDDRFGTSIAIVGDVNGDGSDDVAVGAPGSSLGGVPTVRVVSGQNGATLFNTPTPVGGDRFGAAVAAAGDVDGDGHLDVLVGAPQAFSGTALFAGKVYILSGLSGAVLRTYSSATAYDALGTSVAGCRSIDGDGIPDALIAAPQTVGAGGPGHVEVRSGATGLPIRTHTGDLGMLRSIITSTIVVGDVDADGRPDIAVAMQDGAIAVISGATGTAIRRIEGPPLAPGTTFELAPLGDVDGDGAGDFASLAVLSLGGTAQLNVDSGATGMPLASVSIPRCGLDRISLAAIADVNGDSRKDLVLGFPASPSVTCASSGEVQIRSGATGALLRSIATNHSTYDGFGFAVSGAGDLDGDGITDVLVGAPATPFLGAFAAGAVYGFSTATGLQSFVVSGTLQNQTFGIRVASIGDLNGDGIAEFAATNQLNVAGTSPGSVEVWSPPAGLLLATIVNAVPSESIGRAIAAVGDADGDGVPDLAVSAGTASSGGTTAARVIVVSGATFAPRFMVPDVTPGDLFGWTLAPAGDWNGDGLSDVIGGVSALPGQSAVRVVSFAGVPAGSMAVGSGCPQSNGDVPVLSAFGGQPTAITGNPAFGFVVSNAPPGVPGVLVVGGSMASWGGTSLPLSLSSAGLPGCSLFVSPDVLIPFTTSTGVASHGSKWLSLPVPVAPSLVGARLAFQAYAAASTASALPGAVTRAVSIALL